MPPSPTSDSMRYRPRVVPAGRTEGIATGCDGSEPHVIAGCGAAAAASETAGVSRQTVFELSVESRPRPHWLQVSDCSGLRAPQLGHTMAWHPEVQDC